VPWSELLYEVARVIALIESGKFYDCLNNVLNEDRDGSKAIWLKGFLYRSRDYEESIEPLVKLFPAVNTVLQWFHSYKKESGHTLASILQSSESYLVNRVIIDEVDRTYPSSTRLNLYDGFITDTDISDVIEKASFDFFGFRPVITIKEKDFLLAA
jgi:hypothetical protein